LEGDQYWFAVCMITSELLSPAHFARNPN
jgi:hypothetical protein